MLVSGVIPVVWRSQGPVDLDRSAQLDVPYQVKTAYGLTDSFKVSGVAQQGGPFSPVKSTLTTSLANHWLHDVLDSDCQVTFQTHNGSRGLPHTPDDRLRLRAQFLEAMDDSVILTPSLDASRTAGLHVERFQAAYGWETSWPKSLLAILQAGPVPDTLPMPSVDPADPDSPQVIYHPVAVTADHCEFLRVRTNDPETQFQKIRAIIASFSFPVLHTRLPFTAVRRIIVQCLVSQIRPYLSYQPISRAHAGELDHLLASRIHRHFRFPFQFNSSLLFLPVSQFGFGFPSITSLNDNAAVSGLVRDLNHHVSTFATMARITLADWTCLLNGCCSPLEGATTRSFTRARRVLPAAWVTALAVLRQYQLAIRTSDLSYLYTGDVALRHLARLLSHHPLAPSSLTITNLERAHLSHLTHLASWSSPSLSPPVLSPHPHIAHSLQPFSAGRDWPAVQQWLASLSLSHITAASAGFHVEVDGRSGGPDAARGLTQESHNLGQSGSTGGTAAAHTNAARATQAGRWTLALPPKLRQHMAESAILAAARLSPHPPLSQPDILASDASAVDRPYPHVTFAAATPSSSVVLALAPHESAASSLHGEVFALVVAALLHLAQPVVPPPKRPPLYTDHLNSVRFFQSLSTSSPSPSPSLNPALPLYHWLLDICNRSPNPPLITYTPAHTPDTSPPAQANRYADLLASSSNSHDNTLFSVPLPTFTLPPFVLHTASHNYVLPSSISSVLDDLRTRSTLSDSSSRPNTVLFRPLYDTHPPPPHPYTRASSAYSALVQLYSRSSQLDSAYTRYRRLRDTSPTCHFGCGSLETPHHLFVQCPHFAALREEACIAVVRETSSLLDAAETPLPTDVILRTARALFTDDPHVWPQTSSHYHYGMVPSLPDVPTAFGAHLPSKRLLSRVAALWHSSSIRLTARIWGSYKRTTYPFPSRTQPSLLLPAHLSYLLL